MASKFYPRQAGTTEQSFKIGVGQGKFSQNIDVSGLTADRTWVVPDSNGVSGDALTTDGAGNLTWVAPGAASDSTTPFLIPATETYTVNADRQALYAEDITIDGNIVINGDLIDTRAASPILPSSFVVTLTGNVTGTGNTGTNINTIIPIIAANVLTGNTQAVNNGCIDSMAIGYGSIIGDPTIPDTFKHYITAVGSNTYASLEGGVALGGNATASTTHGTAVGFNSTASGSFNATSLGSYSAASGTSSFALGSFSSALGDDSLAIGTGTITNTNDSIIIGQYSITHTGIKSIILGSYMNGYSAGTIYTGGHEDSAKTQNATLRALTANATPTEMFTTKNTDQYMSLEDNFSYIFTCQIVGTNNTDYFAATLDFVVSRNVGAATTAIQGTPVKLIVTQTGGASAWDVNVSADVVNGRPNISVTGDSGSTVYWSGSFTASAVKTV